MKGFRTISTVAVVFMISSTAHAQSLAEAARKERARRLALTTHARIITNDDFENGTILRGQTQENLSGTAPVVQTHVRTGTSPVVAEPIRSKTTDSPKLESSAAPEKRPSSATLEPRHQEITGKDHPGAVPQLAYIVRPGDTLWKIAEIFLGSGRRWRDVQQTNRLADPKRLRSGDRLRLPPTTIVQIKVPKPRAGFVSYRVKRGESLWSISEIVLGDGASWQRLLEWNPHLGSPKRLRVGQFLYIPDEVLVFESG